LLIHALRQSLIAGLVILASHAGVVSAQVNVTTYHNDIARSGQNTQETLLSPVNVNANQFGKLFTVGVDSFVYAQPLYVSGVSIAGGTHNVLYVATAHDSVYAIDADSGIVYWQDSLIPAGGRTVIGDPDIASGCDDTLPEIGITGTPVIDAVSGTLYVVAKAIVNGAAVQYLHALDLATGAEKLGGPTLIQGSVAGLAYDAVGGYVYFNALYENQRAALLLENDHVVIAWTSHCDVDPWHGWIM
jgi:outer membrane protein assembly factor BamB